MGRVSETLSSVVSSVPKLTQWVKNSSWKGRFDTTMLTHHRLGKSLKSNLWTILVNIECVFIWVGFSFNVVNWMSELCLIWLLYNSGQLGGTNALQTLLKIELFTKADVLGFVVVLQFLLSCCWLSFKLLSTWLVFDPLFWADVSLSAILVLFSQTLLWAKNNLISKLLYYIREGGRDYSHSGGLLCWRCCQSEWR